MVNGGSAISVPSPRGPGTGGGTGMMERILIAEDDPAIADSVGYSLRACGYHVDVMGSGEAVLESAPGSYDLLILDVMLPGLSGVEVCRRAREINARSPRTVTGTAGRALRDGPAIMLGRDLAEAARRRRSEGRLAEVRDRQKPVYPSCVRLGGNASILPARSRA